MHTDTAAKGILTTRSISIRDAHALIGRGTFPKSRSTLIRWLEINRPGARTHMVPGAVSFLELVSLEVVRRLSHHVCSLARTRSACLRLHALLPEATYPFAHRAFLTNDDGLLAKAGIVQDYGPQILAELAAQLGYADDVATWWDISQGIRIDPRIQGGQPCIADTRIPVWAITTQIAAGEEEADIAALYALDAEHVNQVLCFARDWRMLPGTPGNNGNTI